MIGIFLLVIKRSGFLCSKAYYRVTNARIAIKGFIVTGIEPFNNSIFIEGDFSFFLRTEIPHEEVETDVSLSYNDYKEIDLPNLCLIPGGANYPILRYLKHV
ncbi:hypothetical protein TNIN_317821 [Trichonephila inaurata madagascariensis]|uniref:Uncharacterized protein n=1 Tax=Trichonephila inaurata madagascariensis TaxID=2747483 RepID=A0A8X6XUT8_9ARAC|nr:hypothetical protein TNIN_317821 [Trichonephila inaurata madagascariensis]